MLQACGSQTSLSPGVTWRLPGEVAAASGVEVWGISFWESLHKAMVSWWPGEHEGWHLSSWRIFRYSEHPKSVFIQKSRTGRKAHGLKAYIGMVRPPTPGRLWQRSLNVSSKWPVHLEALPAELLQEQDCPFLQQTLSEHLLCTKQKSDRTPAFKELMLYRRQI